MKSILMTASAAAALFVAAPALAEPVQAYGTLGYTDDNGAGANAGAVTGRLGARFLPFLGVEGEVGVGVGGARGTFAGAPAGTHLKDEYGGYAVGFIPVTPKLDILGRVGYGAVDNNIHQAGAEFGHHDSGLAYGAGVQYFMDGANGVRVDYTRQQYGPLDHDSNVWSLAVVRKF